MTLQIARSWPVVLVVGAVMAGCGKPQGQKAPLVSPAPAVAHTGAPLTEAECQEFGKRVEATIASGDLAKIERVFRFNDLCERCVSDLDVSPEFRQGMLKGLKSSQSEGLLKQLADIVQQGGSYTFLRALMDEHPPRIVMRVLPPDGTLNYHLLPAVRFADGQIAGQDIDVLTTGEPISQSIRRLLVGAVAEQNRGFLQKLVGSDKLYSQNIGKIQTITQSLRQGQHQEAFDTYNQLPPQLQDDKMLQILGLMAAQRVGDDAYRGMLEKMQQKHGQDPSMNLITIDYYLLNKQWGKALKSVDSVETSIGGDPYLWSIRGNVLVMAERYPEAITASEKAIELEPTLAAGYWSRITVALKQQDHADTTNWLKKVVTQCHMQLDLAQIKQSADYADYVKSPEFPKFAKWYAARTK